MGEHCDVVGMLQLSQLRELLIVDGDIGSAYIVFPFWLVPYFSTVALVQIWRMTLNNCHSARSLKRIRKLSGMKAGNGSAAISLQIYSGTCQSLCDC